MVMKPISAHLTLSSALVLAPTSIIELELSTDHEAMLSVDGQVEVGLNSGDTVRVRRSPHVARFLRQRPPAYFFATLTQRLTSKRDPFLWTGQ
jgi:NAD+ kinase